MEGTKSTNLEEKLHSLCSSFYLADKKKEIIQALNAPNVQSIRGEEELELVHKINEAMLSLADEITAVSNLLTDRYTKRFPEMSSLGLSPFEYAQTVLAIGDATDPSRIDYSKILPSTTVLAMAMPASTTMGKPLTAEELTDVLYLAQLVIEMHQFKRTVLEFLEGRMSRIAPNVTAIVGTTIATQLIASTEGISALSKIPAGNILVIGRNKKKELAGFSLAQANPHAGYVFSADLVTNTPPQYQGRAQRLIANKLALAARIDAQGQASDGSYGRQLRQEIIGKLEKLIEPAPINKVKLIPPPPIESSKKRGGKRMRKQKELYAQTRLRKMTNRMEFGRPEEEIVVGSSVVGLGELGASSSGNGRMIRAPVLDNKLREHLKKQSQKAYSGFLLPAKRPNSINQTSAPISGVATSMSITPNEGIKLATIVKDEGSASKSEGKYFSTNFSFRK